MTDSETSDDLQKQFKGDYIIRPSKEKPKLNTANWPLLLKVHSLT